MTQMNLSAKQKQTHKHREQICCCQGGGGQGSEERCIGRLDSRCKPLYIEWINKKVLTVHSTGNYTQYPVINHSGKEHEKEWIYMYNWNTLLYRRN